MTAAHSLDRFFTRYPVVGVLAYFTFVALLLFAVWIAMANIYERRAALATATDLLEQLERRARSAASVGSPTRLTGSAFLEGQTLTIAGAALQQRVTTAINAVGGNVLSSQVDLQGTPSKIGAVTLTANCEVDQSGLQQLLYDLETGMPFLFIDQLAVQTPQGGIAGGEAGRLRVLLTVSGDWEGAK